MAAGRSTTKTKKKRKKVATKKSTSARKVTKKASARPKKTAKKTASSRKKTPAARRKKAAAADSPTLGVSPIYLKALADYEKAMAVFHKREFARAEALFDRLISRYPGERDLADRARVYGNLCRRQTQEEPKPQGFDEHYYRGIVLSNQGDFDGARHLFEKALQLDPESGKAHYSLAACLAQVGDVGRALESLRRAVELDADSGLHARNDDDFLPLKGSPEFDEIVGRVQREPAG